jgi:YegS/Rv2252/BmrU family lipid kinase
LENIDKSQEQDGSETSRDKMFIFILNPTAGKHKALELKDEIYSKFEKANMSDRCIFTFTQRPLHATELARHFSDKYGEDAIIFACGGDGTINEVLNGLIGSKSILSVIPAGTGNDFVKSINTMKNSQQIIENIFNYKVRRIDCANLSGRIFINVSSLGFDTMVGDRAKKLVSKAKFLGGLSYFIAIFLCLFGKNYSKMKYRLTCVDENGAPAEYEKEVEFVLAAIANGKGYGGMFLPCPMAVLDDGFLDVCVIDRLSPLKILSMVPRYIKGTHTTHPAAHFFKVTSGHIEGVGEELLVNCDGESFVKDAVDFEIMPGAVEIAYY